MCGIELVHNHNSVFWGNAFMNMNRNQTIDVLYTTSPLCEFKKRILPILKVDKCAKFIWLANNRFHVDKHELNIVQAFDEDPDIFADIVPLTGDFIKEQKMWHTHKFCKDNTPNLARLTDDIPAGDRPLNPQVLTATCGCAGIGIDSRAINGVGVSDLVGDASSAIQFKGRAGRYFGATPEDNWFLQCLSLESYCNSCKRHYLAFRDTKKHGLYELRKQNLAYVTLHFVLPIMCLHVFFELTASNPFFPPQHHMTTPPCRTACSFCRGEYGQLFRKVIVAGVQKVLIDIFLDPTKRTDPLLTINDGLVNSIRQYVDDNGKGTMLLWFASRAQGLIAPVDIKKVLLCLLANNILSIKPQLDKEAKGYASVLLVATLQRNETDGSMNLYDPRFWERIATKE